MNWKNFNLCKIYISSKSEKSTFNYDNLGMIIPIEFRIKSSRGIAFRK